MAKEKSKTASRVVVEYSKVDGKTEYALRMLGSDRIANRLMAPIAIGIGGCLFLFSTEVYNLFSNYSHQPELTEQLQKVTIAGKLFGRITQLLSLGGLFLGARLSVSSNAEIKKQISVALNLLMEEPAFRNQIQMHLEQGKNVVHIKTPSLKDYAELHFFYPEQLKPSLRRLYDRYTLGAPIKLPSEYEKMVRKNKTGQEYFNFSKRKKRWWHLRK